MIKTPYLSFRKSVEFVMLIVFFLTNVTSSYAMEGENGHEEISIGLIDGSPSRKYRKSFQEVSPDSVALVDIDVKGGGQKKRPSLQTSSIAPTCLYRGVSIGDYDETEIRNTDIEEGGRKLGGVPLVFSLSIQNLRDQCGGNDVDITETDSPIYKSKTPMGRAASRDSIDAINVLIEDGDEVVVCSPIYTPKTKIGTEEDKGSIPDPSTCDRACFSKYSKKTVSVVFSLLASLSFGFLAYGLGEEINQVAGIAMLADGLIANALLYYTIYDGLSTSDFFVDWNQPRSKNAALFGFGALNLIASIPLGYYIGYSSILGYTPDAFAQFTGAVSFISLLLLYSKAATRFSNDISNKVNMMKLTGKKREDAYARQAYLEEVAALRRSEVDNLFNFIASSQDNDFNAIRRKLKPKGANDQFWTKEIVGGVFGLVLAGGFGGGYLCEIGFHIYSLFLEDMIPQLSEDTIRNLSYAGACAITVGPNTLQIERTYSLIKTNTIQFRRTYDAYLGNNPLFLTSVFDEEGGAAVVPFERKTSFQERGVDALVFLLAGGVALTRTALCLKYIKDRSLKDPITVGTTIAYFCIYYSVISLLFDKWSETGRKRNIIAQYINAEFDKLDAEKKEDDRL